MILDSCIIHFFGKSLITWHKKDIVAIGRSFFCFPAGIIEEYPSTLIPPGWFLSYVLFFYIIYALLSNIKYKDILFRIWELMILFYTLFPEQNIRMPVIKFLLSINFLPILIGIEIKKLILSEKIALGKKAIAAAWIWLLAGYAITGCHYPIKYDNRAIIFLYILPFAVLLFGFVWMEWKCFLTIGNNMAVKLLGGISKASYSIFLTHYITLCLAGSFLKGNVFLVSLDVFICVITGAFCFYLIEKPVKNVIESGK